MFAAAVAIGAETARSDGVLWTVPANIVSRDLLHGRGGKSGQPAPGAFVFDKEDESGTNPKFLVTDARGVRWKVKLGQEAQPEVAASRLVWAAGYYTDIDYLVPQMRVTGLPEKLHRGKDLILPGGVMKNARLERTSTEKKVGSWKWRDSPFYGTREFNGLRVLMAVLNNWDLKDANTAIYEDASGRRMYAVSDLGAAFGATGVTFSRSDMKGNLEAYRDSQFLRSTSRDFVNFRVPANPQISGLLSPVNFVARIRMQWIGKRIPREDAHWMGTLLGRLSAAQIRDAFRAAHYTPAEVEGFAQVVERRVLELHAL